MVINSITDSSPYKIQLRSLIVIFVFIIIKEQFLNSNRGSAKMVDVENITSWVHESLKNEDINDFKVDITGKSEKGEGYLGDIIFVKVTGRTKSNEHKELDLVLKMGKKNKTLRDNFAVRELYERELFVYSKVFPVLRQFQRTRGIAKIFDSVPKCYNTILLEDIEIIVFEDLKSRGFEIHDRQYPLNNSHIQLILRNYAKYHAISFAMRDQNQEEFDQLTENYTCMPKICFLQEDMANFLNTRCERMKEVIRKADADLEKLFCKVFEKGPLNILTSILDIDTKKIKEYVITHGDCWNNNFMFKYKNGNKETPTDVAILDWQLSSLHSPVIDLSYFLYIVSGEEQVAKFDEFLRFYHTRLSEYMIELGSDPQKMFPFSTLMDHWDKYSAYGIIFLINSLELMLCDKDEAISFEDFDDMTDTKEIMDSWNTKVKPKNQSGYKARALATVRHYCEHFKNKI